MVGGSSTMVVAHAVAAERWRRRRAATVLLVVLAGVSAAVPMALWSAANRTSRAIDDFIAVADVPDASLYICPPGFDEATSDPQACFEHDPVRELDVIRSMPEVDRASRFGFSPAHGGTSPDRATWEQLGVAGIFDDIPDATLVGEPIVVAGQLPAIDAPDELAVTEATAEALDLHAGDDLWLSSAFAPPDRQPSRSTVTGVVRTAADLLPLDLESVSGPPIFARRGWVAAHADEFPAFQGLAVWFDGTDQEAFTAAVRERLEGQVVHADDAFPTDERENIDLALDFETRAAVGIAALTSLVAAFLVGQAVARQARSESGDSDALLALGMTRRQVMAAALLRWSPVALVAVLLALALALGASSLGPLGVARRGPWDRSIHVDHTVLLVGVVALVALVLGAAVIASRRGTVADADARRVAAALPTAGPPGLRTGVALALRSLSRRGSLPLLSAVGGTAVAMALVITAAGGLASFRLVLDETDRFGVAWDALVESAPEDVGTRLAAVPGVTSASWIVGEDADIGDDPAVWLQTLFPVDGVETTEPVIVDGQAPDDAHEIAIGARTRATSDAAIGTEIEVRTTATGRTATYEVVGVAMITDGFEPNVGHGAIVTPDGFARVSEASEFADVGVEVVDGAGREEALRHLDEILPSVQAPFPVPASLANAERISDLPLQLAIGAAALAAVTLGHALITSIRRNRQELAVYRVLGFTRGQVVGSVASQATVLAVAAVAIGVPVGIAGARWGWRTLAGTFGVATEPIVPFGVVVVCAVAALVVANLAACPSGYAAARSRPAKALRTE